MSEKIIAEARSWIGTKFLHQGRLKKTNSDPGGCDCIGLIMGIAQSLNLCSASSNLPICQYDRKDYARLPSSYELKSQLDLHLKPSDKPEIGNVVLMRFNDLPQHVGILAPYLQDSNKFSLIHAYLPAGKVIEHIIDESWQEKIIQQYNFK